MDTAAAGVSEMNVEGGMRSLGNGEVVPRGCDASVLLCTAATWSHLVVGEGVVFCHCNNRRRVLPLMKDACPNVACQSSAVLLFAFAEPFTGLLASACMDGGSGVSRKVKGIHLMESECVGPEAATKGI
jgi:hypothetical protein